MLSKIDLGKRSVAISLILLLQTFNFFSVIPLEKKVSISDLLADGSNNAFVTDTEFLSFLEKSLNGTKKFTKLNEKILSNHWGFQFMTNDFMFKAFNRKVKQLVESGLADLIIRNANAADKPNILPGPIVLKLFHLEIWFKMLLMMMVLASIIFILENMVKNRKLCLNKMKNLLSSRLSLKRFFFRINRKKTKTLFTKSTKK